MLLQSEYQERNPNTGTSLHSGGSGSHTTGSEKVHYALINIVVCIYYDPKDHTD